MTISHIWTFTKKWNLISREKNFPGRWSLYLWLYKFVHSITFCHCFEGRNISLLTKFNLVNVPPIRLFWKYSKKGATQKLGFQKYNNYNRWYFNIYPSWTIGVLRLFVVLETFQKGAHLNINKTPSFQYLARLSLFEVLHLFVLEKIKKRS